MCVCVCVFLCARVCVWCVRVVSVCACVGLCMCVWVCGVVLVCVGLFVCVGDFPKQNLLRKRTIVSSILIFPLTCQDCLHLIALHFADRKFVSGDPCTLFKSLNSHDSAQL